MLDTLIEKKIKMIELIQDKNSSYSQVIGFFFGEKPPKNNDFLSRVDTFVIEKKIQSPGFNSRLQTIPFSVIIPTKDGSERIAETLISLAAQDKNNQDFEILIIDDGSSKSSMETIKKFIANNPHLQLLYLEYKKNRGVSFARNLGIKLARGNFICFTDDDCLLPSFWISSIEKSFKNNPEVAGVGSWYKPQTRGVFDRYVFWYHIPRIYEWHKSIEHNDNKSGITGNMGYRKDVLTALGGFNHYFRFPSLEDWELKIRAHKSKYSLLYDPQIMATHQKKLSAIKFIRHFLLRGWASFLLNKIYPDLEGSRYSFINAIKFSLYRTPYKTGRYEYNSNGFPYSRFFAPINFLRNFSLWFGKYWIGNAILKERESNC